VTLIVLAGFVGGVVIAVSRFDDPRWLSNGWFRLGSVVLTAGVALWLAVRLDSQRVRRAVQLSAVLSLLAHSVLMVLLYNHQLGMLALDDQAADVPLEVAEPPTLLPDYYTPPEQQQPEFEKPADVNTPDQATSEVEREQTELDRPSDQGEATPLPGVEPEVSPAALQLREREQAAPRRSEESSRLSKQLANARAPAPESATPVDATVPAAEAPAAAQASIQPVERQEQPSAAQRDAPLPDPVLAPRQEAVELARRPADRSFPTAPSSLASIDRRVNEPQAGAAAPDEPQPAPAGAAELPAAAPAESALNRAAANLPQRTAAASEPALAPTPAVAAAAVPRQQPQELPTAPAATAGAVVRAAPAEAAADSAAAVELAGIPADAPALPAAAPAAVNVARAEPGPPGSGSESNQPITSNAPQPSAAPGAALARAERAGAPEVAAPAAANRSRAVQPAQAEASPAPIESPALAQSSQVNRPEVEPGRSALSKGTAGLVGGGQDLNLDRGLDAASQAATPPSGSALRRAATQTAPAGTAAAPSEPARLARSIAGAPTPASALAAEDVPAPTSSGAEDPSPYEATSSAALKRASADVPRGTVTAAVGAAPIDVGPTQVAPSLGAGRTTGGGAPVVRSSVQGSNIARAVRGGAPVAGIDTPTVADSPAAPAAPGGGGAGGQPGAAPAATAIARAAPAAAVSAVEAALPAAPAGALASAVVGPPRARAESAAEATPTIPAAAGGAPAGGAPAGGAPAGRAPAAALAADTRAEPVGGAPSLQPGEPEPAAGSPASAPTNRVANGLAGPGSLSPPGGAAGNVAVESALSGSPGAGLAPRRSDGASAEAPQVAAINIQGPLRSKVVAGLPQGVPAQVDEPAIPAGPPAATKTPLRQNLRHPATPDNRAGPRPPCPCRSQPSPGPADWGSS
jgi:nicotinate-nucleotide--dimethylbenzimidazole phosphoribosyltransferase